MGQKKVSDGWKFWKWKTFLKEVWESVSNPAYKSLIEQRELVKTQVGALSNELKALNKTKQDLLDRIKAADAGISLLNKEIDEISIGVSFKVISLTDIIDKIKQKMEMLSKLEDACGEIANIGFKEIMEKMMDAPINTFTEMLVFPNPLLVLYKKELFDRYRTMELSEEDDKRVAKEHYPWSHNPSDLCRVYLPLKDRAQNDYFSNKYILNGYMNDTLGGNFIYDELSGISTLK